VAIWLSTAELGILLLLAFLANPQISIPAFLIMAALFAITAVIFLLQWRWVRQQRQRIADGQSLQGERFALLERAALSRFLQHAAAAGDRAGAEDILRGVGIVHPTSEDWRIMAGAWQRAASSFARTPMLR
jgi:hypothetical protein